ncbi:DNA polymerase/3'-5' exonuclease PolX, partial [Patescibacteria group bacterium]|nr:DNA polymerase/3'-5' exonuclease PolX [Patescibacteria group bacterium]
MINIKIADIFNEIANILEIQNENFFRVKSYRRVAQNVLSSAVDIGELYKRDPKMIDDIPGVGKDLAKKIIEIIETGECEMHQRILKNFPTGLLDMLKLRNVGPKKVKLIYENLGIKTIKELEHAAKIGALRDLPGMGEKSEQDILNSIENAEKYAERILMPIALNQAEAIIEYMKKIACISKIQYAGSLRRHKETIGDIDILICTSKKDHTDENIGEIMSHFEKYEYVTETLAKGQTKSSIVLDSGIQVDLRIVENQSFGAALHYFTGSKNHNIAIRDRAKRQGLKINEYGVFKGEEMIAGNTEESVFEAVGLPFIIPELRKDDGEIEAAEKGKLPKSIELKDLKGDLHMHTNETDGNKPVEEIADVYYKAGYKYIAITDHSKSSTLVNGLDEKKLLASYARIDELNKKYEGKDFRILKGAEIDILSDGSLDYSDEILAQMEIAIASIHSGMTMPEKEITERVIKAMKNPYIKILGHPTGRLINRREPLALNMETVIEEIG